jgi:hypothetical protein
MFSIL